MSQRTLQPHRITRPFQLLAAWLFGLIALDTAFLTAAVKLHEPKWLPVFLVVSAVLLVPLFLACFFLLQTKFRHVLLSDQLYVLHQLTRENLDLFGRMHGLRVELQRSQVSTLSEVQDVQTRLSRLRGELREPFPEEPARVEEWVAAFERELDQSSASLESIRRTAFWSRVRIAVNELLPFFDRIVEKLESNGASVSYTFGTASDPPVRILLSFGTEVPYENVQSILDLVSGFGVDSISFAREEVAAGEIYIGSYAYMWYPIAPLTEKLRNALTCFDGQTEQFQQIVLRASTDDTLVTLADQG